MHRVSKGEFGYIRYERKVMLAIMIVLIGLALGIYFTALFLLGTNQNYFTIIAVLLLLPGAQYVVKVIMFFRAPSCSAQVHESVEQHIGSLAGAYDLYMTSEKKNYPLSHLSVGGKCVIALTEDPDCDTSAGEKHIRQMMLSNGFHGYTVKIFTKLSQYNDRLDQLNRMEGETMQGGHEELMALMYNLSL